MDKLFIDPNIATAETLSPEFYHNPYYWELSKEKIFSKSWLHVGNKKEIFRSDINTYPYDLLPKYLDEPILLIQNEDKINCTPNICTHRGFKLVQHPSSNKKLTCKYHGRRFNLEGKFEHMPEFKEVENFPRPCDHLTNIPISQWLDELFVSFNPHIEFKTVGDTLDKYLSFLDLPSFTKGESYDEEYTVNCHWALYLENYLEGFHIPFVHNALGSIIDYGKYDTLLFDHCSLQIGYSDKGSPIFDLPDGHPDYGKDVTAYYFWLFPNFMLNVYPWGVQYNIVKPVTPEITKVSFKYYIKDQAIFDLMDASKLAVKTEREDEFVVEEVHKGIKSRFYNSGRFSAKREKGVHYFQQLLADYINRT